MTGLLLLFERSHMVKNSFFIEEVGQEGEAGRGFGNGCVILAAIPPTNWDFGVNC